ncbi:sentrin-specific protease 6 [Trichonephila inaurata madagascariensis]|uniref:Sentrin-specific protease 6 n=1 Tax=Trichonephila inaurata madagascariensis TaxID=2747483 RepID=A0A8X6Y3C5_9ARAC|nr:sentrin-specific protease 6 [Trichonephila inaurata madagascariensis]
MEPLYVEPLSCASVRVGTYKVFPSDEEEYVTVYMTPDSIKFNAPNVEGYFPLCEISIKCDSSNTMKWCLGEKPALFVHPSDAFAEEVRFALDLDLNCPYTFDPALKDFRSMFVILMINFLTEEQIAFIRHHYFPINTCTEINQEGCGKLLYKTAPRLTTQLVRIRLFNEDPSIVWEEGTEEGASAAVKEITVASYRSKSRAGVIPLSNRDVICLNEGKWLNDNIVNFYLEYIYIANPHCSAKTQNSWKGYKIIRVEECEIHLFHK